MSLEDVERAFPFAPSGADGGEAIDDDQIAAGALESVNEAPEKEMPIPDRPTPYLSTVGRKAPSEWGKPDYILHGARKYPGLAPAPWMPQISDVRGLVKKNAAFFVQHGSRPSQIAAAQMATHSDKWWSEFAKGRQAQAKESLEQYRLQQLKLVNNEKRQYKLLADAYAAYSKDPAKLKTALINLSYRFDDPVLRDVIQTQGLERAEELISSRHNNSLDQLKIIHQREQNAKIQDEVRRNDEMAESIRQITDPYARSPATQSYLDTGKPRPDALPSTDPSHFSTDPIGPKYIPPLNLPQTAPATSADVAQPLPPPFPTGVTRENVAQRRGELSDWANAVGQPLPPPDTAGLYRWLDTNQPSGHTAAPPVSPAEPAPAADTPDLAERNRLAALVGYTGDQLDRYAWDYFMYGRLPHTGSIPKDLQSLYHKQNAAVVQRATGPGGIEEWIHKLITVVGPAPLGMSDRESVARADQILDKIGTIKPEIANQIRGIIHGFTPMPSAGFGATAVGPQRFRELVYAIDPTYKPTRNESTRRTIQAFSGNGVLGQRILAFKTAINHASTMMKIIDQMPNTPIVDYNRFLNNISTRLGAATANEFNLAWRLYSTEVARSFRGNSIALGDINELQHNMNANSSPAQMRAAIRVMSELMMGQLNSLADQYNFGTMMNLKGEDLFADPAYMAEFRKILGQPFPASAKGFSKTPEAYRQSGNTTYSSDMPNEGASLNAWLAGQPRGDPKAEAVREKLRGLGWLSKGNE